MTREEAYKKKSLDTKWLIDKIYDDFESRTCESCEYASGIYSDGQLTNFRCKVRNEDQWSHVHEIGFGCNKWSNNDNSTNNTKT